MVLVLSPPPVLPTDRYHLVCVEPSSHDQILICIGLMKSAYFTLMTPWDPVQPNLQIARDIFLVVQPAKPSSLGRRLFGQ